MRRRTISVGGMSCAACSARVEKALNKIDVEATVNLLANKATVTYDENKIDPQELQQVIIDAGYEVPNEEKTLLIQGMSCAACSARVEKALNKMDGVEASVNLATNKAKVVFPSGAVTEEELIRQVEEAGYEAQVELTPDVDRDQALREKEIAGLKRDFIISAVFTLPIFLSMFPYGGKTYDSIGRVVSIYFGDRRPVLCGATLL